MNFQQIFQPMTMEALIVFVGMANTNNLFPKVVDFAELNKK